MGVWRGGLKPADPNLFLDLRKEEKNEEFPGLTVKHAAWKPLPQICAVFL
jgi:hypothetical protein